MLNLVNAEINKNINECSQDTITKGTKIQLSAEEILAVIEAILTSQVSDIRKDSDSNHCKLPKVELPRFSGDNLLNILILSHDQKVCTRLRGRKVIPQVYYFEALLEGVQIRHPATYLRRLARPL
ncbi:hypothetical protein ACJJTC_012590 [Scirpophaga incertulas]